MIMPIQEKEMQKAAPQEEKLPENSERPAQKLLSFLQEKADFHQSRINTINEKIAVRSDKIARNKAKIEQLSAKADRLEDKNAMLKATMGSSPGIRQIIEANERKIKEIREEKIPNRQNRISGHQDKITQLSKKRDTISHKLNRVIALSDTIKSFSIGANKERRAVFTDAMHRLKQATTDCLNDKKTSLEEKRALLYEAYSKPETSAVDKIQLQSKINAISSKIETLENKLQKISRQVATPVKQDAGITETRMQAAEKQLNAMTDQEKAPVPNMAESVITEDSNYLRNAEMEMEDDYNSIDGIINNGRKEEPESYSVTESVSQNSYSEQSGKINPEFYQSLSKEDRKIEVMLPRQAEKVMEQLTGAGIAFSAVVRQNGKTAVTVDKKNAEILKSMMQSAFQKMKQESKTVRHQLGDDHAEAHEERKAAESQSVKSINPDYFKSLTRENRSIHVETVAVGKKVMDQLEEKGVAYSAVERRNHSVAITVSKADEQAYQQISGAVKAERAAQYVNPDFYKALPKEQRATQRMSQEQAESTMQKLDQKGIAYSAVLHGEKSAVTVEKKHTAAAFMSRASLKREAQRISSKGKREQSPSRKQGLEQ